MSFFRKDAQKQFSKSFKNVERRLAKVLFYSLIFVSVLYIMLLGLRYQVEKEHRNRLVEIQREGFPVDVSELQNWADVLYYETVTENSELSQEYGQTSVDIFQQAFDVASSLEVPPEWPDVKTLVSMLDNAEGISEQELSLMHAYVETHQPVLDLLYQGASLPSGRFFQNYSEALAAHCPYLNSVRDSVQLLRLAGALAAFQGDAPKAEQILVTGMAVVYPLVYEPLLVSQLTRVNLNRILLCSLGDALQYCVFTDAQLVSLQRRYRELHPENAFYYAFILERATFNQLFGDIGKMMPDNKGGWLRHLWGPGERFTAGIFGYMMAHDRGTFMNAMEHFLAACHLPYQERTQIFDAVRDRVLRSWLSNYSKILVPSLARTSSQIARDTVNRDAFSTAIAVERYRLAHNIYPDGLQTLVPAYLDEIPKDPFDLHPLRYFPDSEGYRIYSVGPNGVDNGGFTTESFSEGDIVFRVRDFSRLAGQVPI